MPRHRVYMLRFAVLLLVAGLLLSYRFIRPFRDQVRPMIRGGRTVAQVMAQLQSRVQPKIDGYFRQADLSFPPARLALLAIKDQQRLEVWAAGAAGWRHIVDYHLTAYSGTLGPKLAEGDCQIPEGIYRIDHLNPNSQYHLSMRVNYPNDFDRRMARRDNRIRLGGDIYIHGKAVSIGCIAIGDEPIEELFYMVATTGKDKVNVIIAPSDLRSDQPGLPVQGPSWTKDLYAMIRQAMGEFSPPAVVGCPVAVQ